MTEAHRHRPIHILIASYFTSKQLGPLNSIPYEYQAITLSFRPIFIFCQYLSLPCIAFLFWVHHSIIVLNDISHTFFNSRIYIDPERLYFTSVTPENMAMVCLEVSLGVSGKVSS